MATNALARVSGFVLKVDRRTGVAKATNEPYDFTQVKVVVADSDVTEVTLPTNLALIGGPVSKGDLVDFLVEFRVRNNGLSGNVQGLYPAESENAA